MTPDLDTLLRREPWAAAELTAAQVADVLQRDLWSAARYLGDRLTPAQVADVLQRDLWSAAEHLRDRLTPAQVAEVVRRAPWAAARHLAGRLTAADVAEVIRLAPDAAVLLRRHVAPELAEAAQAAEALLACVTIAFPEDSETVFNTVAKALLLNDDRRVSIRASTEQIELGFDEFSEAKQAEIAVSKTLAALEAREKVTRDIFAHHAIQAHEIEADLREVDEAIGDPSAVETFVVCAVNDVFGAQNLFHRPDLAPEQIAKVATESRIPADEGFSRLQRLRALHVQLDQTVLAAYGWDRPGDFGPALELRHDFYPLDFLPENDRTRLTLHPESRREVLARLLKLNHQRAAAAESAQQSATLTAPKKKAKRAQPALPTSSGELPLFPIAPPPIDHGQSR